MKFIYTALLLTVSQFSISQLNTNLLFK